VGGGDQAFSAASLTETRGLARVELKAAACRRTRGARLPEGA